MVQNKKELFGSTMMRFIVIDVLFSYNAILGKETQGNLHIHPEVRYLMISFETKEGDTKIFIDQAKVRKLFGRQDRAQRKFTRRDWKKRAWLLKR